MKKNNKIVVTVICILFIWATASIVIQYLNGDTFMPGPSSPISAMEYHASTGNLYVGSHSNASSFREGLSEYNIRDASYNNYPYYPFDGIETIVSNNTALIVWGTGVSVFNIESKECRSIYHLRPAVSMDKPVVYDQISNHLYISTYEGLGYISLSEVPNGNEINCSDDFGTLPFSYIIKPLPISSPEVDLDVSLIPVGINRTTQTLFLKASTAEGLYYIGLHNLTDNSTKYLNMTGKSFVGYFGFAAVYDESSNQIYIVGNNQMWRYDIERETFHLEKKLDGSRYSYVRQQLIRIIPGKYIIWGSRERATSSTATDLFVFSLQTKELQSKRVLMSAMAIDPENHKIYYGAFRVFAFDYEEGSTVEINPQKS